MREQGTSNSIRSVYWDGYFLHILGICERVFDMTVDERFEIEGMIWDCSKTGSKTFGANGPALYFSLILDQLTELGAASRVAKKAKFKPKTRNLEDNTYTYRSNEVNTLLTNESLERKRLPREINQDLMPGIYSSWLVLLQMFGIYFVTSPPAESARSFAQFESRCRWPPRCGSRLTLIGKKSFKNRSGFQCR